MTEERKRIFLMTVLMVGSCLTLLATALLVLYCMHTDRVRAELQVMARSQARMIELVARHHRRCAADYPNGVLEETISQIREAHRSYRGFGKTGAFALARKEGDMIVFLLSHRLEGPEFPEPVPYDSSLAEPMQMALSGLSGTTIGKDYRGQTVIAAYEPVGEMGLGIVAKIDLAEARAPFLRVGALAGGFAVVLISVVVTVFFKISGPMVEKLERYAAGLEMEVAERRRAEEALREKEEFLRSMLHASPVALFALTPEGKVNSWNKAAERIFGWSEEEVKGEILPIVPEEYREEFQKLRERVMRGESFSNMELKRKRKDGTLIDISLSTAPVRSPRGETTGIMAAIEDITERKKLKEQFFISQKMEAIGNLAGGVAHDFNNALTPIMGISEMLLGQLDPEDPVCDDIKEMLKAGERCASLTRQLLAFARRQPFKLTVLNLNQVVANVEKMLSRLIGEDVELVIVLDPELENVKADAGQIEQIIVNLAVNARDAMPWGGKLIIETKNVELDMEYADRHVAVTPGPYVMLAVSDTGEGMDEETREKIFEPFFTTKEKDRGTGLGLSTVYGIVKQSGGNIWCYSEPGIGTTFKVYLPRAAEKAEQSPERETTPAGSLQGSETVLVVEDDESVRRLECRALERHGYRVLKAASGEEALKRCEAHQGQVHLMITDVVMPGMSGKELAERLAPLCPDMKIIYVSGYTDEGIVRHGVLEEGTHFIQKPFTVKTLARKVREVLDRS